MLELKKWDLKLPLEQARKMDGVVVALADSQILSWINEINGTQDYDIKAREVKKQIKFIKKQETSIENRSKISELYKELYRLQFREDYVCVVMKNNSHYKRANAGFRINGISYKRLLCTTGGVKTSTVVYVSDKIHQELKKRLSNNHNINILNVFLPTRNRLYCSIHLFFLRSMTGHDFQRPAEKEETAGHHAFIRVPAWNTGPRTLPKR